MKKLLIMAACFGTAIVTLGQGQANFNTKVSLDGINAFVTDATGAKVEGPNFVGQLLFSDAMDGSYTPVGVPVEFGTGNKAGYILTGGAVDFGVAAGDVWVVMKAWDTTNPTTEGMSNPFMIGLKALPDAPANLVGLESFSVSGEVIPEPSTFALGLLGIGALMLRRRK
jgi:hypothetical protein